MRLASWRQLYAHVLEEDAGVPHGPGPHGGSGPLALLNERVAVVARDETSAREALRAHADGSSRTPTCIAARRRRAARQKSCFCSPDRALSIRAWPGSYMTRRPCFDDVIDHCDALLGPDARGRTLTSVLWAAPGDDAPIHDTAWTQPALFALEYGLTQVWRSWGIEPAAVIGHSVGEYVAACVAGVFNLEEGLRLIAERGRLMQALPPGGTMAAIFAPVAEVAAAVAPMSASLSIAAINAADSVVVSGAAESVDALLAEFAQRDVKGHRLFVSLAAHSPLVEPALDAMEACASPSGHAAASDSCGLEPDRLDQVGNRCA